MSSTRNPDHWRSSSSRLLGLYCILFVAWSSLLLGVMYWRISDYLSDLTESGLQQRVHLFLSFDGPALDHALRDSQRFDLHQAFTYGLFSSDGTPIAGPLTAIPEGLPLDGSSHPVDRWTLVNGPNENGGSALGVVTRDGRTLVFVRQNGKLMAVNGIILDALLWGVSLTIIPGLVGWHLLRRRPLQRIQQIESATNCIVGGDLGQRLPVSSRRDEIDRLSSIVNAMLERIEQLMTEVKGVCDSIAHDLRTPLTRLRAHLYRIRAGLDEQNPHADPLDKALAETDMLMARFTALLRVSELESHQRRSAFDTVDITELLQELHQFYLPLAEEKQQLLELQVGPKVGPLRGDRELLFEALANLLSNALQFTPAQGRILLRAVDDHGVPRIDVIDNGPGIPPQDRTLIYQRFFRGSSSAGQGPGFGLGLSIVAAIVGLHGFRVRASSAPGGGAWMSIRGAPDDPP